MLQKKINCIVKEFGDYFSVCFRFQNLLGDFEEYNFKSLNYERQKHLIEKCISILSKLKLKHNNLNCVVTSDSISFLEMANKELGCYYVKGNLKHMGSDTSGDTTDYEKSFLDFYILAQGSCIYNVVVGEMYPSGFPLYAAKIYNIPFERIIV